MASISKTPLTASRNILETTPPLSSNGRSQDNGIWKRIDDVGIDPNSIRRRDKSALVAYIATLEAQINDLHHDMGTLIMETKDSACKSEEARLSAEKVEVKHLRQQAALSSVLAEARKREEKLQKSLGVERECVANIEKALHEMRVECAEVKITAKSRMAEARNLVEDTQQKYAEAEVKLRTAESLRDEARRSERAAGRKLQEVEAREDDLRRRMTSFNCDAKEQELMLERRSLAERQRVLSESQNKLVDSQTLLNQREADILSKSQALKRLERELEDKKENIAAEMRVLMEQKSKLELNAMSVSEREKVVVEKEVALSRKEQELLVSQEMLTSKEHNDVREKIAEQEIALRRRRDEFDVELLEQQKLVEDSLERKRRAWELRELDLKQREDVIFEKEQDLEVQSRVIADKGKDLAEKMKTMQDREHLLNSSENEVELTKIFLQKEREEMEKAKIDLEISLISLEKEKNRISEEKVKFELMKSDTSDLFVLETKLKEEIDMMRDQKQHLDSEAEKLKIEKAKFETEWEFIDVKREELQREEERIAVERVVISNFLKEQRDSLSLEKEALREQYKQDLESLTNDREVIMSESQRERSDWFSNFQKEQADLLLEIECRKRELEDSVNQRRDDIESYLREKERTFSEEKKSEIQYILSLKEDLIKEQERAALALKKLETEKLEIKVDREQRDKTWAELQYLIEELQSQRLKLKEQREMLHADREEINCQIEQLKKLEDEKVDCDSIVASDIQTTHVESTPQVLIRVTPIQQTHKFPSVKDGQNVECQSTPGSNVSWLRKCSSLIFKQPSEEVTCVEPSLDSAKFGFTQNEVLTIDEKIGKVQEMQMAPPIEKSGLSGRTGSDEPKVIHEVVPSKDGDVVDPLEASTAVHKSFVSSDITFGARKRKIDSSSPFETDAEIQNDAISNKKRREEDGDAHDGCMTSKQPVGDGQHVSSSKQSERSNEKVCNSLAEVEGQLKITSEMVDTRISHTQVQQSAVDKSVLIENKVVTRIVTEQTVTQELHVVDGGEPNRPNEKAPHSKEAESEPLAQDMAPSGTNIDKPAAVKPRTRRQSKPVNRV